MSPSYWGPTTWIFLHTLAATIKEDSFASVGQQLIRQMMNICFHLPCPECAQHARAFWSKVQLNQIKHKTDLINVLFVFHNKVNQRKRLPPFKYEQLTIYETKNVVHTYNQFARNFNTKGNMQLINESFHRGRMMSSLKTWMMQHIQHFTQQT